MVEEIYFRDHAFISLQGGEYDEIQHDFRSPQRTCAHGRRCRSALHGPVDAAAGTLEEAKAKGKVVIGIRATIRRGASSILAASRMASTRILAKPSPKASVSKPSFVPLAVANRIPALMTGKVDVCSQRWA